MVIMIRLGYELEELELRPPNAITSGLLKLLSVGRPCGK